MSYDHPVISEASLTHNITILWGHRIAELFADAVRKAEKHTQQHSGRSDRQLAEIFKAHVEKHSEATVSAASEKLGKEAARCLHLDYEAIQPKYQSRCYEAAKRAVQSWWKEYFASKPQNTDDLFLEAAFNVTQFVSAAAFRFASDLAEKNQT